MASPQITPLLIRLGIEGFEGVDRLSGAFRNLSKTLGPSAASIDNIRRSVLAYAETTGRTEVAINGTIDALRGLQSQVERGSASWNELTADIERFRQRARATDPEIETLRNSIVSYATATTQSQQSLRSYISDLQNLRTQAQLNGPVFQQLGQDISNLTTRLQAADQAAQNTGNTFRRVLGQRAASTAAGVARQIGDLDQEIAAQQQIITQIDQGTAAERRRAEAVRARTEAEAALNRALTQRTQLAYGETIRTGRERVRTAAAAFNAPEFTGTGADFSLGAIDRRFGDLPNTTEGLNQRLSELRERLANTERGSASYIDVAVQMANVQRELNRELLGTAEAFRRIDIAESGAQRRASKLAGVQQYYGETGATAPGVGGFRDPATGAIIARGAYDPSRVRVNEAAYQRPIGPEPLSAESKRSLAALDESLNAATQLYQRNRVERAELQARYNQLELAADEQFERKQARQRQQGYDAQLADFDRRLEAATRKRGRRMTGMQLAQAGGAAISGGIFGGPEGFLGGAIGGAVGGVGGAFAGAAIGAQVGMFRQSVGEMTAYAAEIRKQRIAIQGVVSSFEDYRTAIQTTEAVANRFNVPLQESTKRFTSLSAAVLGSGGTITQARDAFSNVTAAIIATGGGAEQVNAALTATSQVFSKGKVTAEELRDQLGERLPGAFSLFAESMGVSTKQLDKLLEQGKVGLPEFNKFLSDLGIKFGGTADRMAASSEQAGARMSRAFEDLRITVGDSLGTTGAYFQDFATGAIKNIDSLIERLIKLRVLTPGPNYFVNQVVGGEMSMEQLQQRRRELTSRQPTNPAVGALQGAASRLDSPLGRAFSPIIGTAAGALSGVLSAFGVSTGQQSQELKAVNEAIDKLNILRQNTNKDRQQAKREADDAEAAAKAKERENQAKQLLDLIDQREEQLAEARTNREEQLAEIRKNAIRRAADLERSFADDRLKIERDIRDIRTRSADTSVDNALRLREAMGEDRSIIEAEREVVEIFRRERDTLRAEADRRADEERTQARTIADFQRDVSESINKANETYAKRIGEIQTNFAKQSGKLIEEASDRGAQRLVVGAKLMALFLTRDPNVSVPVGYTRGEPYYGGVGGASTTSAASMAQIPGKARTVDIDRQIGALTEAYMRLGTRTRTAVTGAAPATPRPAYRIPTLPGAAAATAARTQRSEATGEAARTQVEQERAIAFANEYTEIIQLNKKLDRDAADLRARTNLQAEGYTQEVATALVDINNRATLALQNLEKTRDKFLEKATTVEDQKKISEEYGRQLLALGKTVDSARNLTVELANQNALLAARQDMRVGEGLTDGIREYTQSLGTLREATQQLAGTGLKGIESAIIDLSTTGTTAFREFANSIIKDTIRVITQQLIMRSVLSLFNLGGPKLQPAPLNLVEIERYSAPLESMSQGGIASGPTSGYPATLHGNEAVIPLSGSRSIPVEMRGGSAGTTNIVINVEAGTSSTEGPDAGNVGQELARDLARVVDDRLVYHRRPGGLLSGTR